MAAGRAGAEAAIARLSTGSSTRADLLGQLTVPAAGWLTGQCCSAVCSSRCHHLRQRDAKAPTSPRTTWGWGRSGTRLPTGAELCVRRCLKPEHLSAAGQEHSPSQTSHSQTLQRGAQHALQPGLVLFAAAARCCWGASAAAPLRSEHTALRCDCRSCASRAQRADDQIGTGDTRGVRAPELLCIQPLLAAACISCWRCVEHTLICRTHGSPMQLCQGQTGAQTPLPCAPGLVQWGPCRPRAAWHSHPQPSSPSVAGLSWQHPTGWHDPGMRRQRAADLLPCKGR